MGSRTAVKLKEIDELRSGLERKLDEIEHRLPVATWAKRAAAVSGALVPVIAFLFRTLKGKAASEPEPEPEPAPKRRRRRRAEPEAQPQPAPQTVVNVFPKGAVAIGVAAVAVWAGVKVFELTRSQGAADLTVVRSMSDGDRSGDGS